MKSRYLIAATLFVGFSAGAFSAQAKKKNMDVIAQSIAKAREASDAPAVVSDEGSDLRELLGNTKLVAKADNDEASKAAAAMMAGAADAEAAAMESAKREPAAETDSSTEAVETKPETAPDAAPGSETDAAGAAATKDVTKMKETDIPVLQSKTKTAKAQTSAVTRIAGSIGIVIVLVAAAGLGFRRFAKRGQEKNQNTKIKILTQHHIGPKKSVAILQVAGESILVGITDHSISMLKTLSLLDEEIPDDIPRQFVSAMDQYEDDEPEIAPRSRARDPEDFAMSGLSDIRDSVSRRLKGLKEL